MSEGLGYGRRNLIKKIVKHNWNVDKAENKNFNYNELLFVIQELLTEEGKIYFTKRTSKMGFNIFREFVKLLLYRNIANYDSMILVSSEKGTGKSSAAIMIAKYWCNLLGIKFDPNRHIAYNNADVMNKIEKLNKFEPIIADESIRFASSADWAKKENKALKKKLAQVRTKHLLYILCFPLKIQKLEKTYLESYVNYWIDLFGRGTGAIYIKDRNPNMDTWRLKDFAKVGSYNEFTSLSDVEQRLKKHPNYWQIIKFPKPSAKLYERYMKVREKNVYDDANVMGNVSKEDIHNALLVLALRDLMTHDTTLSMNRILLHIKNQYDIPITRQMIQQAINDATQLITKIRDEVVENTDE